MDSGVGIRYPTLRWACALLLLIVILPAHAHDLGLARITLTTVASGVYQLDAKLPAILDSEEPVAPLPCGIVNQGERPVDRLTVTRSWIVDCSELPGVDDQWIRLDWDREGALIVIEQQDGSRASEFVDSSDGTIFINLSELHPGGSSWAETFVNYLRLGFEHILAGIDHLAFVLVLMLLARGMTLVKLVTAFTVGHSITLALASIGWAVVPMPPVEAVIALSIAFLAREALKPSGGGGQNLLLVMAFGMLHGLGFASALVEIGIDSQNLVLTLLAFNIGVELGQLSFIAVLLLAASAWKRVMSLPLWQVRQAAAFGIGSLAVFWTMERVVVFLPVA